MFQTTRTIPLLTEIANRKDLTLSEAVVYSALRFKLKLSIKNNFKDNDGIYVMHEQAKIMAETGLSKTTVQDAMKKLESPSVGLIRRVKLGKSFKIYFIPYEVEDRFLIKNNAPNELQDTSNGDDLNVTLQETQIPLEGQNDGNLPLVGKVVDNVVDNLGIVTIQADPLGTKSAPNVKIGTKSAPNTTPIGAKSAPYNKIFNKKIKDISNINNNNFTLPKRHEPKVSIDYDIYTTFSKCFNKKPSVEIKNSINGLINRGIEKELIINIMQEIGQKGWSWGKALDQINQLVKEGIKTYDQYIDKQLEDQGIVISNERLEAFRSHAQSIPTERIQEIIHAERSEWDGIDQMAFA